MKLEDLPASEVTKDRRIQEFLKLNGTMQCVVTRHGTCYVVAGQRQRQVRALLAIVQTRLGSVEEVKVSPLDFERWKGRDGEGAGRRSERRERGNRTVEFVFAQAIDARASDVYVDVLENETRLAFRTFGFKRVVETFGREEGRALVSAMWTAGKGSLDESGTSDVAFDLQHVGKTYRVRGNSMQEVRGLSVVCRVRDPKFVLPLEKSGYSPTQVGHIMRMCAAPGGLIIISGETNSGKSTTLASLMAALPKTQKIIEVADPVEVLMDHVTHVEVNQHHEAADAKFDDVLAALVRQNPDSLVLGEIRDARTAAAAEKMAIQGKRVFSTLHTQTCAAAIPRLANLGVTRSLLALRSFLAGIVNQNLVPVVCPNCGLDKHAEATLDRRYRGLFGRGVRYINEDGCDMCRGGVSGQTLVAEVYPLCLDRAGDAQALIEDGRLAELERRMRERGADGTPCQTKHQHAAGKVAAGEIDPEATERIIGEFHEDDVRQSENVVALHR